MSYPEAFSNTITKTYKQSGQQWLTELPTIIDRIAHRWHLSNLRPYDNLTYNYVMSGIQKNSMPIVLKLRCDAKELQEEVYALQAFKGHGGIALIDYDLKYGALLLEQAIPGTPLTSLFPDSDHKATHIAAQLLIQLHQTPANKTFIHLHKIIPTFDRSFQELAPFIDRARKIKERVFSTTQSDVLLHGDFHAGNILLSDTSWQAIDPQGIIGNPLYDVAIYMRNPLKPLVDHPECKQIIINRINDFARQLSYTAEDIYDWTYLQAVTSAYWSLEDGLEVNNHVAFILLLKMIEF